MSLIQLPPVADPAALLRDLPHGEPWAMVAAQLLLEASELARRVSRGLTPGLKALLASELAVLSEWVRQSQALLPLASVGEREPHPAETLAEQALNSLEPEILARAYSRYGWAPFPGHTAFIYNGELQAVARPDPVGPEVLVGYQDQIAALHRNIERFLGGKPALATLLYGAPGTGKSTAVKSLRTAYADRGLRLLEVFPEGSRQLPELLDLLADLPYYFLLYFDDLAFEQADYSYRALKMLLEGAVYELPANTLVIATSNRRNLVAETWAERDEPSGEETRREKQALADRFGLQLVFNPFDQELYLAACRRWLGRDLDSEEREEALRFARSGRGPSGRSARQFAASRD